MLCSPTAKVDKLTSVTYSEPTSHSLLSRLSYALTRNAYWCEGRWELRAYRNRVTLSDRNLWIIFLKSLNFYKTDGRSDTVDAACRTVNDFKRVAGRVLWMMEFIRQREYKYCCILSYGWFPGVWIQTPLNQTKRKNSTFKTLWNVETKNENIVVVLFLLGDSPGV
jgi:hypothetical protein